MRALRFLRLNGRQETGASAVEYGLLAALIAAIVVAGVLVLGQTTQGTMSAPCDSLAASGSSTTCD
ncbi:MAG: Flp family type IVb pilin [Actinomycetota bacterium]|nr:Flp family type IVb pilin [Actinomycetota bacterium]